MLEDRYDQLLERAYRIGAEHGENAASWYFDGNTDDATYRRVLQGIIDCDPMIYDTFPANPLSGEWADSYLPQTLLADVGWTRDDDGYDVCDDIYRQYEDAYDVAVSRTIEEDARRALGQKVA